MSGDTPEHSLDCPGCGSEAFTRDVAVWYTDEDEHCPGCGSRVIVALDEDDADPDLLTARVYVYEHGGEVVARLRAEVERLTVALAEERVAKDEARKNLCRKVIMTARDLPVRVRRDDATDAMCSDHAEVADAWGWGYLYPEATP